MTNTKMVRQKEQNTTNYTRSDYESTFAIPRKLLRLVTIHMTHQLTPFVRTCWNIFYWFEFFNKAAALSLMLTFIVKTATGGTFEDAIVVFSSFPCMGMVVIALAKSYTLVVHRPVYENLVNEVGDMWPQGELNEEERNIVGKALKQLLFIIKGYYWCNNALMLSFYYPPLAEAVKRAFGYDNQMTVPFNYWLPFNPYQPVYVDVLLLIQIWQGTVVIFCNFCGDVLFCAYLSHITTQFDLLSLRIQRLVYVPVDNQLIEEYPLGAYCKEMEEHQKYNYSSLNGPEWEEKHQRELSLIIERHVALIRLSADVEKMFAFSMLVTFLNSSVIICLCGFCCVVIEKWNDIAYKSFLLTALSETYLICWFGQKLLDSSKGVSSALYNSGWYQASKKIRSSVIIMLLRSQREVQVTTYGFSIICLESYSKLIKTAWSYFTLLINTISSTYKQ